MGELFTLENLGTLLMLVALQAVLGFDNLLYISLESKRAPQDKQKFVRTVGIGIAIVLRIGLLFALKHLIQFFDGDIIRHESERFSIHLNVHSLIFILGGGFIIYTAIKEIWHMIGNHDLDNEKEKKPKSVNQTILMIVLMNLVFSFDSILSAMALTDSFVVMATAIVIGGLLMIWLSGAVSRFLEKNRLYEVLGLFILFIVGIMLLTEGGEHAQLQFFGNEIHGMSKTTFYFVIITLVLVDVVQGRFQKKILAEREREEAILDRQEIEESISKTDASDTPKG